MPQKSFYLPMGCPRDDWVELSDDWVIRVAPLTESSRGGLSMEFALRLIGRDGRILMMRMKEKIVMHGIWTVRLSAGRRKCSLSFSNEIGTNKDI